MTFIDRYVYDVGRRLPRKERDDIEAELKSNLYDTLDDPYYAKTRIQTSYSRESLI